MFFVSLVALFSVVRNFLEWDEIWTLISNGAPCYYNLPWDEKMKARTEWEKQKEKIEGIASVLGTSRLKLVQWFETVYEHTSVKEWDEKAQNFAEWAYKDIVTKE